MFQTCKHLFRTKNIYLGLTSTALHRYHFTIEKFVSSLTASFSCLFSQCYFNILKVFKLQLFARVKYSIFIVKLKAKIKFLTRSLS